MTDDVDTSIRSAQLTFAVTEADLAPALGSGDVPVLATPRMIAWLEAATVAAIADSLSPDLTSVGTSVEVDHVAASPIGTHVTVSATVRASEGSTRIFDCEAIAITPKGRTSVIGQGSITRIIVDRGRFLARLAGS